MSCRIRQRRTQWVEAAHVGEASNFGLFFIDPFKSDCWARATGHILTSVAVRVTFKRTVLGRTVHSGDKALDGDVDDKRTARSRFMWQLNRRGQQH